MTNELINFKNIALSNDLLDSQEQKPNLYDLKVVFDTNTKLVSIKNNVESESMFNSNYVYDSSRSITMMKHFENAAIDLQRRFNPQKTLEIGSNSGIFIKHFPNDKHTTEKEKTSLVKFFIDLHKVTNSNSNLANKTIKVLQSKVKTYEQDINKRLEEIETQNYENDLNSVKN